VEEVFVHPSFNSDTLDNDIALIKLEKRVELGHYVGLACLPERR
jgi:hypothetical protein